MLIIYIILAAGVIIFSFNTYRSYKSGSTRQLPDGRTIRSDRPVPLTRIGSFWYAIICAAALVAVALIQHAER